MGAQAIQSLGLHQLQNHQIRLATLPTPESVRWHLAGGEVDVRGCYTAMAAAHMLRLDKAALARKAGMIDFVRRCQVRLHVPPTQALDEAFDTAASSVTHTRHLRV